MVKLEKGIKCKKCGGETWHLDTDNVEIDVRTGEFSALEYWVCNDCQNTEYVEIIGKITEINF